MNKWVCGVLVSVCLSFPLCGSGASLEEMARPMHETSSKHWVSADWRTSSCLVNTKYIHYDKATKRLSFWTKSMNREERTNPQIKRAGSVSKVIVDIKTMSYAFEYSDGWDIKEDRVLEPTTTSVNKLSFDPILPDDCFMENPINMALELAKLPTIPKPHSYKLVATKKCPSEELPDRVKSRAISMYLCTDFYVKDISEDIWRFYIKLEYYNKLTNGKSNQYVYGTQPVYVNFKKGTIQFEYPDNTYKINESGYPKDVYDGICELIKSKNDTPEERI